MNEEDPEDTSTAVESAAAVAATSLGLVVAGPVGALAGAAAGPVLARIGHSLVRHLSGRAEQVLRPAVDELGGDAAFEDALETRPDLAALVVRTVSAAGQTIFDQHVRAMAKVLRDAAAGAVNVEPAVDLVDALAALTPARVVVLKALRDSEPEQDRDDHWDGHLTKQLALGRGATRGALIGMELTGAVASTGAAFDGGERWRIQPLGLAMLEYLDTAAEANSDTMS